MTKEKSLSLLEEKIQNAKIIALVGENGCGKTTFLRMMNANKKYKSFFLHQDQKYRESLKNAGREMTKVLTGKDIHGKDIVKTKKKYLKIEEVINKYFNKSIVSEVYEENENLEKLTAGIGKQVGVTQVVGGDFNIPIEAYTKLDSLSSGEQEIITKMFILSESFDDNYNLLLLDEPETGLHPKWQKMVVSMFEDMLEKNQKLFIATHSENILKELMLKENCTIFKIDMPNNKILLQEIENTKRVLPFVSFAEIQYLVFGIATNDYHNEIYSFIQNEKDVKNVEGCDTFLKKYIDDERLLKNTSYKKASYETLTTAIRNEINHPDIGGAKFSENDLILSIEFMRNVIKPVNKDSEKIEIDGSYEFDSDLDFNAWLDHIHLTPNLEEQIRNEKYYGEWYNFINLDDQINDYHSSIHTKSNVFK